MIMARDRLSAFRARQERDNNPASSSRSSERPIIPQGNTYEMSNINQRSTNPVQDMTAFYAEIHSIHDSIRVLNDKVSQISDLHSKSLNSTDEATVQQISRQLDELASNTHSYIDELKARIKTLFQTGGTGVDSQTRRQQTTLVNRKFMEAIQNYEHVEQQYRAKYKQRMARQIMIVKPDATPEEIKAIVDKDQAQQVFVQALQSTTQYGETRAAYREVQERNDEIKTIERNINKLAQLFNDMSILVEQQDQTVNNIEIAAADTEKNTAAGLKHTDAAVASARRARRARWICFIIIVVIVAALALALGIHFGVTKPKQQK